MDLASISKDYLLSILDFDMKTITGGKAKRGKLIGSTIRARVKRGLLEPLEKIELPEGKEITLTILGVASDANVDAFRRSAGSWKGSVDAEKLIRNIYNDRLVTTRSKPRL